MKKLITFFASIGIFLSGLLRAEPISINKPLAIILMGPPGSGKGTNAEDLRDHFKIAAGSAPEQAKFLAASDTAIEAPALGSR